ncbi:hypothetical protein D1007_49814 [Hordeum vulgare]|nr:hypothetical protein D1007_49814 [Hordeum vulgare]
MDIDLDAVTGLAFLASFGITIAPSRKAVHNERANRFMQRIIFEGVAAAVGGASMAASSYDPKETQSEDAQGGPFMSLTYDQAGMQPTFMQDQVGLDMDGFPPGHVFSDDYDLEE